MRFTIQLRGEIGRQVVVKWGSQISSEYVASHWLQEYTHIYT